MSGPSMLAMLASTVGDLTERWRTRWHLRFHAPLDDDACEGDLVYVAGTVCALDETLVAPLTGRTCVGYRSRARNGMGLWLETMRLRPFAIERDDTGEQIVVDGERAIFGIAAQKLVRDHDRVASFRAFHAITKVNGSVSEVTIDIGARVAIGGTLVLVPRDEPPTGERGFRDQPPPDSLIAGNRDAPLVIVARDSP